MVRALERSGFAYVRQQGSHAVYAKGSCRVVVPMHAGATIKPGTLQAILDAAGLSVDALRRLL
jgi:predicted RNA binding protein YcfA (HicA-like mRNA interferase family)